MPVVINNHNIEITKQYFTTEEIRFVKSLGSVYTVVNGQEKVVINIARTSKQSMYYILQLLIPNLKEDSFKEQANNIFSYLKKYYDSIEATLDLHMQTNLIYYPKILQHQKESVLFGLYRRNCMLALQQRLGKCLVTLTIDKLIRMKKPELNQTLIISPVKGKYNWQNEIRKWGFPLKDCLVIDSDMAGSRPSALLQFKYLIINFDILEKFIHLLEYMDVWHVVIDECHRAKSTSSQRFKHIKTLVDLYRKNNPDSFKLTFLSGTPIKRRNDDMFAYLNLSGHILGKSLTAFRKEFCETEKFAGKYTNVVGSKNNELLNKLLSNFMIRKKFADCVEVPPNNFVKYYFEFDKNDKRYVEVAKQFQLAKSDFEISQAVMAVSRVAALMKVKSVIKLAEDLIEDGEKVAIFSFFTDVLDTVKKHFGDKCVKIDGSVTGKRAFENIEAFRTNPDVNVIAGQTISAGEAVDMSVCSKLILCDLPFGWADLEQVIFRFLNVLKSDQITIYLSTMKDTLDEHIADIVLSKHIDSAIVYGDKELEIESFDKLHKVLATIE